MLDYDKVLQWALDEVCRNPTLNAKEQIAYLLIISHGGNVEVNVADRAYRAWIDYHGKPTKGKVLNWVHQNTIQLVIGLSCLQRRHQWVRDLRPDPK